MWITSLGSRGFETGSVAIEGEPLGYCRSGGQGRTDTNGACAELVQRAYGRLAPPFESERRESVQTGFEERSATRWWSDSQRSLVCGQNAVPNGPAYRIWHPTIFVAVAPASATDVEANSNRSSFYSATLPCKRRNAISDASRTSKKRSMIDLESQSKATRRSKLGTFDSGCWR